MRRLFMRWRGVGAVCALVAAASAASLGRALPAGETVLAIPGRANATPSVAAAGTFVAVTWAASLESGPANVYVAASIDAGRTFGPPVRVSGNATVNVSGEQPPRVVLSPRQGAAPAIVVVWTAKAAAGTQVLSARSDDGGRTFSAPAALPGSAAAGNRGWESVAVTPSGDVLALWLDHRELASTGAGMNHAEHRNADGAARAQLSKLFFGPVTGNVSGHAIAGGVCYCCKTALAAGPDGAVYAAWRHVYPGNVRDIAFTLSGDGGKTFAAPVRVSDDQWALDGCPENGPAMAVDTRRRIHVVWPTLVAGASPSSEPTLALFHAMSSDGRHFTARQRIASGGAARHPQLALGPRGDLVVVWDESVGGRRQIAMAGGTVDAAGKASFARWTIEDRASATHPVVAMTNEGPLVAWTSGSATTPAVVRVARISR